MTQIKVYDIQWHWNYGDHCDEMTRQEYDNQIDSESTEVIIDVSDWDFDHDDIENIEDSLSDYISYESGYYHEGFSWEWI